ncbi:MAG: hypothetical protein ACOCZ2_05245 [Thermodesulfobacteriota bacterium]
MADHIFADGIKRVSLSNNNIRVVLNQNGPENTQAEAGTLIIPVSQASGFVNALASSLRQLDEQIKARTEEGQQEGQQDD